MNPENTSQRGPSEGAWLSKVIQTQPSRKQVTGVSAVILFVVYAGWLAFANTPWQLRFFDILQVLANSVAIVILFGAAYRARGPARLFWLLVGIAFGLHQVADVGWAVYHFFDIPVTDGVSFFPSFFYRLAAAALAMPLFLSDDSESTRVETILDGCVAVALVSLGVYHTRLAEIAPHDADVFTNVSISVIVNAVLLISTIARFTFASRGPMRGLFGRLAVYLVVLCCVHATTTYMEQFQPDLAEYSDRLWIVPYLAAAGLATRWRPAPFEKRNSHSKFGSRRTRLLIFNIGLAVMVLGSAILGLSIYGESRLVGLAAIAVAMLSFAVRCALMQSAQEKLVEALWESNERFKFVSLATNDILWDRNLQNDSVSWNESIHTVFGYPHDAVGNLAWWVDKVHPLDRERVQSGIRAALDSGEQSWRDEYRFEKADGSYVYVMDRGYVIRDSWGAPLRMVGTMLDLTLRREIEAQLERAREAAEAAARSKSEFLANMSHEIRTPMNAVIGMTTILLDTSLSHEQQDCVEIIRTAGDTLLSVINDILDFSKIESGKLEPEQHPLSVRHCIEEAFDLVSSKAAEKGLDVAYLVDDHVPSTIVGDITRLRQVLVNLLNNAIKFTHEGEVVASVSSRQLDDTRVELEFAIRDTGIGIPRDRIGRLFQSFSQVDPSTTREYGGTGLGLAISSRLAEMMGGRMWVESTEHFGSTFLFTIVARAAAAEAQDTFVFHPDFSGKRVLVVDDNATNRKILARYVESWGMIPYAVSSPAEGLRCLHDEPPFDVAILDHQMPEMDGVTLGQEIRKLDRCTTLPLVLLSSSGISRTRRPENGQQAIFAAYLTKPIKAPDLHNILGEVLLGVTRIKTTRGEKEFDKELGARHPLKILLAEDNAVNQMVALALLQKMGYRADLAANGLEVIDALQRQPYDVVLMDMHMPELDGLEAARHICQAWPKQGRPRIIAMTANAMQGDKEKCLAAGMDDYVSKPIKVEELQSALRRTTRLAQDEILSPAGT